MLNGFDIATALASEIAALLDLPARAEYYVPVEFGAEIEFDEDEGGGKELIVVVAAVSIEVSGQDRGNDDKRHGIEVAVCKMVESKRDPQELKTLLGYTARIRNLFEEVDDETESDDPTYGALRGKTLAGATWDGTILQEPLFDRFAFHTSGAFMAVPRFTFREDNA